MKKFIFVLVTLTTLFLTACSRFSFASLANTELESSAGTEANIYIQEVELVNPFDALHDEVTKLLQEFFNHNSGDGEIGISYLCLTTGRQISVNGDQIFRAQSTIKLAAHMMVAEAVNRGELAWNQLITITEDDMPGAYESGFLYFIGYGPGSQMSLYNLMRYSITHSDNLGFTTVMRRALPNAHHFGMYFTDAVYHRFFPGEQASARHRLSPNQQAAILRELYDGLGVIAGYEIIVNYMMNTEHQNHFITDLTRGYVAHIPGWWMGSYYHDSGIFFADKPFILVVYTLDIAQHWRKNQLSDAIFTLHTK